MLNRSQVRRSLYGTVSLVVGQWAYLPRHLFISLLSELLYLFLSLPLSSRSPPAPLCVAYMSIDDSELVCTGPATSRTKHCSWILAAVLAGWLNFKWKRPGSRQSCCSRRLAASCNSFVRQNWSWLLVRAQRRQMLQKHLCHSQRQRQAAFFLRAGLSSPESGNRSRFSAFPARASIGLCFRTDWA